MTRMNGLVSTGCLVLKGMLAVNILNPSLPFPLQGFSPICQCSIRLLSFPIWLLHLIFHLFPAFSFFFYLTPLTCGGKGGETPEKEFQEPSTHEFHCQNVSSHVVSEVFVSVLKSVNSHQNVLSFDLFKPASSYFSFLEGLFDLLLLLIFKSLLFSSYSHPKAQNHKDKILLLAVFKNHYKD